MTETSESTVLICGSSVDEIRSSAQGLLRRHAEEAEPDLADVLDPDWEWYLSAEETGQLVVIAAFAGMQIIGYAVATIFRSQHYSVWFCQHDLLYVHPEWRGHRVGLGLIERLREEARARDVRRLLMHAKKGSRLEALLPRLGFEVEETVFKEEL